MFCPTCRDEFRPGFTRCGRCNVDLVEDLSRVEEPARPAPDLPAPLRLAEYCGFLSLDEARSARDRLREHQIRSEIVLREPVDARWDQPVREEYWLRVDTSRLREVRAVVGEIPEVEADEDESGFACGDCGRQVAGEETACPACGARFDE